MEDQKKALLDKLKDANNILVTVSANPSADQLAAAIGLTIFLNKLKKHATAVFSGRVPSNIDFLQPGDTLEKNTNSLRDFIISLDKSKADKLRYKVEENVVKIFITPYRTSLSQDDLEFGQGDFNVDLVLALGVHEQKDLDEAIVAHGRILHDATVSSVNIQPGPEFGSINWVVQDASSLSELATELVESMDKNLLDGQIATAFLTGIVSETGRFSNEKTSPETMRLSAELLSAGANQQLVSTELQKADVSTAEPEHEDAQQNDENQADKSDDGTLEINHPAEEAPKEQVHEKPEEHHDEPAAPADQPPAGPSDLYSPTSVYDVKQNTFDLPVTPTVPVGKSQLPPQHYVGDTPAKQGTSITSNDDVDEDTTLNDRPNIPLLGHDKMDSPSDNGHPDESNAGSTNQSDTPDPSVEREEPRQPLWQPKPHEPASEQVHEQVNEPAKPAEETPDPPLELPTPTASPLPPPNIADFQPLDSEPLSATPTLQVPPAVPVSGQPIVVAEASSPAPEPNTLADIEKAVHSPHAGESGSNQSTPPATPDVDSALKAVHDVYNSTPVDQQQPLPAKQDIGASGYLQVQDLPGLQDAAMPPTSPGGQPPMVPEPIPGNTPADTPLTMPLPPSAPASIQPAPAAPIQPITNELVMPAPQPMPGTDQNSAPPVPPPLPPSMTMPPQQ